MDFSFTLEKTDSGSSARAGTLKTAHGEVKTPVFMPIGTQGTVKGLTPEEISNVGVRMILGNTYHLYLRPGLEILKQAGGLHKFANWPFAMLTDSGGYQVFSLAALRKIHAEGVRFQSHIDGSYHEFTPENVIEKQRAIGADVMMVLDECPPYPSSETYCAESNQLTAAWAKRCKNAWTSQPPLYGYDQALFAIVQGGVYPHLRQLSARQLIELDFPGYAIGGLAVGEPADLLYEMTGVTTELLPVEKPRYLMGVGKPENLVEAVRLGVDMFDCVIPTRNGRKGQAFTRTGTLNLRNAKFKELFEPIEQDCQCYTCQNYSCAYIRHLFQAGELLGMRLVSLHNIYFFHTFMADMRKAILSDNFEGWRKVFYADYNTAQ